jgi:hypothetical protein
MRELKVLFKIVFEMVDGIFFQLNFLSHIMLSETSQAQKDKWLMFSPVCRRYRVGFIEVQS